MPVGVNPAHPADRNQDARAEEVVEWVHPFTERARPDGSCGQGAQICGAKPLQVHPLRGSWRTTAAQRQPNTRVPVLFVCVQLWMGRANPSAPAGRLGCPQDPVAGPEPAGRGYALYKDPPTEVPINRSGDMDNGFVCSASSTHPHIHLICGIRGVRAMEHFLPEVPCFGFTDRSGASQLPR